MATYTKTVDPNGGADYASLALWEAGEQTLYTSGDVAVADCRRTGALKDTDGFIIGGWTAGVVPRIEVNAAHRHEGKKADTRDSDGNYIYKLEASFDALRTGVNGTEILFLTVTNWGQFTGDRSAIGLSTTVDFGIVAGCLIYDPAETAGDIKSGILLGNGCDDWLLYNNIILDLDSPSGGGIGIRSSRGNIVANNTVYNCGTGFTELDSNNTMIYTNNLSLGNAIADYDGGFAASSSNNVSSDGTAPGSNSTTGKTDYAAYFVDHLAGDLRLNTSSRELFGIDAVDLSATFSEDNVGKVRPASSRFGLGAWRSQEWRTTVDPNGGADYASIALWEAGEQALYVAGDTAIAECRRTGATKDTSSVDINGWTAGVLTRITTHPDHRHEGKFADVRDSDGNYIYRLDSAQIIFRKHDAVIDHLMLYTTGRGIWSNSPFAITGCVIHSNFIQSVSGTNEGIAEFGVLGDTSIYNNIVVGFNAAGGRGIVMSSALRDIRPYMHNNLVYDCETGITADSDQLTNNNIVLNCPTCYTGAVFTGSSNNVSSDATAPGTSPAINKTAYTDYFVDPANSDFRLKADSATLFGIASADLSATFTDDAVGETRPASSLFGLGPLLYVAGAGGTVEASANFSQAYGFSSLKVADISAGASFNQLYGLLNTKTADIHAAASFNQLYGLLNTRTADINAGASFNQSFGMAQGGSGEFNTDAQMGALLEATTQALADMSAQITEGLTSSVVADSSAIVNEGAIFVTTQGVTAAGGLSLIAAADFALALGMLSDSDVSIEALADFSISCGVFCASIAQFETSISVDVLNGVVSESIAILNASASFGFASGFSITRTMETEAGASFTITSTLNADGTIQLSGTVIPVGRIGIKVLAVERTVKVLQTKRSIKDLGE